jgi:hypothetical protein
VAATNALLLAEVEQTAPYGHLRAQRSHCSRSRTRLKGGGGGCHMAGGVVPGLPWGDAASHVGLKHTSRTVDL